MTLGSSGSEAGIDQAIANRVQIGTFVFTQFLPPGSATFIDTRCQLGRQNRLRHYRTLAGGTGHSYPLINYEYAVVSAKQSNPQTAEAMSNFLLRCIGPHGGDARTYLEPLHFIALPVSIRALSEMQLAKIH